MTVERWDGTRFVPQRITRWDGAKDVDVDVTRHNASSGGPAAPTAPPGAPTGLTVQVDGTTATLRWNPPTANGGGPITQYRVNRTGGTAQLLDATGYQVQLVHVFTGLTPGAAYTLSVSALNSAYEGPAATVGVTVSGPTDPGAQRPIGSIPYGIYRHAAAGQSKLQPVADWVGRQNDLGLDFQATDTADNQAYPYWQYSKWQGVRICLGATLVPIIGNNAHADWSAAARGDLVPTWRKQGERLVANGQANAVLRCNHEFNGDWFGHKVLPGEQANFIRAWRLYVDTMRSVPGQRFSFDWNPTHGKQRLWNAESAWPGRDWVTHVALDVYDDWYPRGWTWGGTGTLAHPTVGEQEAVWDEILNGDRGLNFWADFARAQGLPLSLPEWGVRYWYENWGDKLIHGGGDNVVFVEGMHGFITDARNNVAYHCPWEDPGQGFYDGRVPNATARYAELFHGPRVAAYVGLP